MLFRSLATSPEPAGVTGTYFVNSRPKQPAATALDDAAAARLWQVSSEMVGLTG